MKEVKFLIDNNVDINSSLELFGDIETYNETLKEFKDGINGKLEQIEKYFKDQDMANYAIYVHSLKSDCKYFGFMKLADMAYQHEVKSKENDYKFVKEHYDELIKEISKVKGIVDEYLGTEEDTNNMYEEPPQPDTLRAEGIILVADDSEVIRIYVKKIFDDDYELAFAEDGQQTIDIIKEHREDGRIKAILLDLNMPVIDGFGVLDYLKTNELLDKMPVTIISGDQSKEVIDKAFSYGIVDMLSKPFNESKIRDAVNKTINKLG